MDVIAAISTGSGATAIGIVRVSGAGCFALCGRVFRAVSGRPFETLAPRTMAFGEMLDQQGRVIDRGLAVRFPGPHSYTGEDSAEFHCHGSPVVLRELLSALFAAGARQARAGEFTQRAFLNGRLDLTQAEAVIDLIDAETAAAARNAAAQLDGGLRRVLEPVQEALLDISSRFYAVVDYPDEDITDAAPEQVARALAGARETLDRLLSTCRRGRVLKAGVRTAIVGRPNAGKSSLLNALAGYDRAIVTDIPGTTRDTVEESVLCGGVLLRLIDTAGIRATGDTVERMGVERARAALETADLVLAVVDSSAPMTEEDEAVLALAARQERWILVASKADLPAAPAPLVSRQAPRRVRLRLLRHRGGAGGPGGRRGRPVPRRGRRGPRLPPDGPAAGGGRLPGGSGPPAGGGGPGGGHDPRRGAHRRGGGPGRPGRADGPHRPRGDRLPDFLPVLRGKMSRWPFSFPQNTVYKTTSEW